MTMTKTPRGMNEAPREYKLEDTALQIRKIGNSVGVILPKELLARLNLKEGDKLFPIEQPGGGLIGFTFPKKQLGVQPLGSGRGPRAIDPGLGGLPLAVLIRCERQFLDCSRILYVGVLGCGKPGADHSRQMIGQSVPFG